MAVLEPNLQPIAAEEPIRYVRPAEQSGSVQPAQADGMCGAVGNAKIGRFRLAAKLAQSFGVSCQPKVCATFATR